MCKCLHCTDACVAQQRIDVNPRCKITWYGHSVVFYFRLRENTHKWITLEIGSRPIRVDTRRRPTINFIELAQCPFRISYTCTIHALPFSHSSRPFLFHNFLSVHFIAPSSVCWSIRNDLRSCRCGFLPYNNEQSIDIGIDAGIDANLSCHWNGECTKHMRIRLIYTLLLSKLSEIRESNATQTIFHSREFIHMDECWKKYLLFLLFNWLIFIPLDHDCCALFSRPHKIQTVFVMVHNILTILYLPY